MQLHELWRGSCARVVLTPQQLLRKRLSLRRRTKKHRDACDERSPSQLGLVAGFALPNPLVGRESTLLAARPREVFPCLFPLVEQTSGKRRTRW